MANIKHILVATDLSDRSERACERGIRLARERAATVDLLHVVEGGLKAQVQERRRALAEEHLRDCSRACPRRSGRVSGSV